MTALFFLTAAALGILDLLRWFRQTQRHLAEVDRLAHRIHVNGIRGKSTVTRILAGMLREAGIVTIATSTGTPP